VRLFHGGKVKENGEFESMHEQVHFFVQLLDSMIWLAIDRISLGGH
jgi:hypothetical protein